MTGLFDRFTDQRLLTFSRHRLICGAYMLEVNKHARDTALSKRDQS